MAKRKNEDLRERTEDSSTEHSAQDSAIDTRTSKRIKVEDLNALDVDEFIQRLVDQSLLKSDHDQINFDLHFAKALPSEDFDACFDLIEATSRHDYEPSSFGWHSKRKRREMREKEMRYLIVRGSDEQFLGFLSFMLTYDSTPVVPVVYIYEIHLIQQARGKGLGNHLMGLVEDIANRAGMDKVMLTCFLSNTKAHSFYQRLGYSTDESSPEDRKTRNKTVKVDYVIMSKDLREETTASANQQTTTQVMRDDITAAIEPTEANTITRLDECETALRAWTQEHKAEEALNMGLEAAASARDELCRHNHIAATGHRGILMDQHDFLERRYEAARDLTEILREQMYHLKSQIADVNRLAESMAGIPSNKQEDPASLQPSLDDTFDMEKATEQIYSAFFTLMRKAEEVDNRLDDVAHREEEASQCEEQLNEREEEFDEWEADLHEREKALAEREERLARSQSRLARRAGKIVKPEDSLDTSRMREFLLKRGPPPIIKVNEWLRHSGTPDSPAGVSTTSGT